MESSAGMSVEGLASTARSSFAIRIARTSQAVNLTVALFFLLLPSTGSSNSCERKHHCRILPFSSLLKNSLSLSS